MYNNSGPLCTSPPDHSTTLYHPKPVRPTFTESYSAPVIATGTSPPFSSTAGSASASSSPSPPNCPPGLKASHSLSTKSSRSKMPKKMSSTTGKHKTVQVSLEVKVERSRGFHAFFVPLARSMPPAPPSSPVFGQSANAPVAQDNDDAWSQPKSCEERWVEDVNVLKMDLD